MNCFLNEAGVIAYQRKHMLLDTTAFFTSFNTILKVNNYQFRQLSDTNMLMDIYWVASPLSS
jgi:hypothetical protein